MPYLIRQVYCRNQEKTDKIIALVDYYIPARYRMIDSCKKYVKDMEELQEICKKVCNIPFKVKIYIFCLIQHYFNDHELFCPFPCFEVVK